MKIGVSVSGGERPLIGEGGHVLRLVSCSVKEISDRFSAVEGAVTQKLLWQFVNASGEAYAVWTNTKYGHEKASLTGFLDMIVPGISVETAQNLDTDDLIGQRFRARIVHKKNASTGKVAAQHTFLEPIDERTVTQVGTSAATPSSSMPSSALTDPFADEE